MMMKSAASSFIQLSVILGLTLGIHAQEGSLVVNEVASKGTDLKVCSGAPYIEFKNTGATPIDPSDFALEVFRSDFIVRFSFDDFDPSTVLDAGAFLVVCSTASFNINDAKNVKLENPDGQVVSDTGRFPGIGSKADSFQRVSDGSGYVLAKPTPGKENAPGSLVINEVANKGTDLDVCGGAAYIEFKNIGTFPIDPSDFSFDVFQQDFANFFRFNGLSSSPPLDGGAFLVLCKTASEVDGFTFDIGFDAVVRLQNPDRQVVSTTGKLPGFGFGSKTQSFQRLSDGSGYVLAKPTPNKENAPGSFVVNEVASKGTNLAICGGEAYIEFKNIGTFPIDPSDFVVIVEALPNLNRALVKDLDSSTVLDGGAFLVVCSTASFNINGAEEVRLIAPVEESLVSNPDDGVVSTTGRLPGFGFESKAQSFQRLSDESGYVLAKPTPGNENAPAFLVVNEVANKGTNLAVCGGDAYVEFKNIGTFPIDPSDFILSVREEENDDDLIQRFFFRELDPRPTDLDGGAFLVVCRATTGGGDFNFEFPPREGFDFDIGDKNVLELVFAGPLLLTESVFLGVGSKAQSFQRLSDGSGFRDAKPTPDKENVFQEDKPHDGTVHGDPHFKTWRGKRYDFHGACDLIFIQSKGFESGLGLDVHIRTKMRGDMSYISSAVLRIGSDVLEVESQGLYYLNGVANAELPSEFSGFEFLHTQPTDKQHVFEVHLGGRERIKLKTYKELVSVLVEQGLSKHFVDSVGLLGDFGEGRKFARDGKTILDDANAFGQEWQVLGTEPTLFQNVRFPQHPQKCTMPTPVQASQLRRRLLETSSVDELAAEKACEHWGEQGKDDCVFDVLTTGYLEMALVGAY